MGLTVPADQIHQAMQSGEPERNAPEVYRNLAPLRGVLADRGWTYPGGRIDRQIRQDGEVAVEAGYVRGEVWVKALKRTGDALTPWRVASEWKIRAWDPNDAGAQIRGIVNVVCGDAEDMT